MGRHLARSLASKGHEVVLIARGVDQRDRSALDLPNASFFPADLNSVEELARAFSGCGGVAHCAGINREIGQQAYERVHVQGTRNVMEAARIAGVGKVALLSFLRARANCGSGYHESKWAAEEIVRGSRLDYTILKAGVIYGRGDHMLDHLSHALFTFPVFATVGLRDRPVRPLAVTDLVKVIEAALIDGRLSRETVAVLGPEEMLLGEAARRGGQSDRQAANDCADACLVSLRARAFVGDGDEDSARFASAGANTFRGDCRGGSGVRNVTCRLAAGYAIF